MRDRARRALDVVATVVLASVFGYAGMIKTLDLQSFAGDIHAFDVLPLWTVAPVAIMLPAVEVVTALSLLAPTLRKSAAALLIALLLAFIGAAGSVMWRGSEVQCGCFGGASREVGWQLIAQDVLLMIPAVWLLCSRVRHTAEKPATTMEFQQCEKA